MMPSRRQVLLASAALFGCSWRALGATSATMLRLRVEYTATSLIGADEGTTPGRLWRARSALRHEGKRRGRALTVIARLDRNLVWLVFASPASRSRSTSPRWICRSTRSTGAAASGSFVKDASASTGSTRPRIRVERNTGVGESLRGPCLGDGPRCHRATRRRGREPRAPRPDGDEFSRCADRAARSRPVRCPRPAYRSSGPMASISRRCSKAWKLSASSDCVAERAAGRVRSTARAHALPEGIDTAAEVHLIADQFSPNGSSLRTVDAEPGGASASGSSRSRAPGSPALTQSRRLPARAS